MNPWLSLSFRLLAAFQSLGHDIKLDGELRQRLAGILGPHALRHGAEFFGPLPPMLGPAGIGHGHLPAGCRLDLLNRRSNTLPPFHPLVHAETANIGAAARRDGDGFRTMRGNQRPGDKDDL